MMLISPSKTQDFKALNTSMQHSTPALLASSEALISCLSTQSVSQLMALMGISEKLAKLNFERYQHFQTPFTKENAKQALFAFKGDVYNGLDAQTLDLADCQYAQQHLRIISGLYGLLRPLDLIQPYRLEMKTPLGTKHHHDLYTFWGQKLTQVLNRAIAEANDSLVINLASQEYWKAIQPKLLEAKLVTPIFKQMHKVTGQFRVVAIHAKRARGLMARFVIQNRLTRHQDLTHFNVDGYVYEKHQSTSNEMVFLRHLNV